MRKALVLLLLLSTSAFAFWARTPSRSNPNDPRSSAYSGGGASSGGLRVYLKNYYTGAYVPGGVVMLGTDAAGAVTTDAGGMAHFPNASLPVDVHAYSPLSAGLPTHSPFSVTAFQVDTASVVLPMSVAPSSGAQPKVYFCLSGTASSGPISTYMLNFDGSKIAGSATNSGNAPFQCNGSYSSSTTGYKVNLSALEGGNSSIPPTGALFYPQFTMGASDVTVSAAVGAGGFSVSMVNGSTDRAADWPFVGVEILAGASATDQWRAYYQSFYSTTPMTATGSVLAVPVPTGAVYASYSVNAYSSSGGQYRSSNSGYRPLAFPLAANIQFSIPGKNDLSTIASAASPSIAVTVADGTAGNLWTASLSDNGLPYNGYWVGLKKAAAVSAISFSLPTVMPVGYGSNVRPSASAAVKCSVIHYDVTVPHLGDFLSSFVNAPNAYNDKAGTW